MNRAVTQIDREYGCEQDRVNACPKDLGSLVDAIVKHEEQDLSVIVSESEPLLSLSLSQLVTARG